MAAYECINHWSDAELKQVVKSNQGKYSNSGFFQPLCAVCKAFFEKNNKQKSYNSELKFKPHGEEWDHQSRTIISRLLYIKAAPDAEICEVVVWCLF